MLIISKCLSKKDSTIQFLCFFHIWKSKGSSRERIMFPHIACRHRHFPEISRMHQKRKHLNSDKGFLFLSSNLRSEKYL